MLVAVIKDPEEMEKAKPYADVLEWRLDYFTKIDLGTLKKLQKKTSLPLIFTLRRKDQGGLFAGNESSRLQKIEELVQLQPDYIDLEFDVPDSFCKKVKEISPQTQIIISKHDFEKTPEDLSFTIKPFLAIYKIACKANSTNDMMRMLLFCKEASATQKIVAISMGECGNPMRVLGTIVGSYFDYAGVEKEESVLYQLTLQELHEIYNYPLLNWETKIYALLGDPVDKSPGHLFHNQFFKEHKINAVYVKLKVTKGELPLFFEMAKKLPFVGFSVTMPLKEEVQPFLKGIDPQAASIGAVNTIFAGKGYNTDAPGALDAIEKHQTVRGKTVAILGAGGAGRAIAYEAKQRGAKVILWNRTFKKADEVAAQLGCHAMRDYPTKYDILINTTPVGMLNEEMPIPEILSGTIVMDIIQKNTETPLLRAAKSKGCLCIYGHELYRNQALLQQQIWKEGSVHSQG